MSFFLPGFQPNPGNRPSWLLAQMRKRYVLRTGYGAMILLLLLSAGEAYRIQRSASQQTTEIYRRRVKEEEILYRVRRILFLGGIYVNCQLGSKGSHTVRLGAQKKVS